MEYLLKRQRRHLMSKLRQIVRLTRKGKVQHEILSLKNVSSDTEKIRSIAHIAENTSKGYAEYMINKSTLIVDVDPNHVSFERLEPRDDFC